MSSIYLPATLVTDEVPKHLLYYLLKFLLLHLNEAVFGCCYRKDVLQDAVNLTNCCREEYLTSSQAVQASVDEVKKDTEYASFINKHK